MVTPSSPISLDELFSSLSAFAATPNLTKAAEVRSLSRPTLRRHLFELERMSSEPILHRVDHTNYRLTAYGERVALRAEEWLRAGENLLNEATNGSSDFWHESLDFPEGWLRVQQHAISSIWTHGANFLAQGLEAWTKAQCQLEAPEMAALRRFFVVARQRKGEWLLIEVGEESSLAQWVGLSRARAEIGLPVSLNTISTEGNLATTYAYEQASKTGSPWYDHVSVALPKERDGARFQVNYRRLVLPSQLNTGSPVIVSLVERHDELVIDGFEVPRVLQQGSAAD